MLGESKIVIAMTGALVMAAVMDKTLPTSGPAPAPTQTARVDASGRQALTEIGYVRGRIAPTGDQAEAFDRFAAIAATIVAVREGTPAPVPAMPERGFRGATPPEGRPPSWRGEGRRNPLFDDLAAAQSDLWTTLDSRQRGILSGEWGRTVKPLIED